MRDLMKEPKWLQAKSIPRSENKKNSNKMQVFRIRKQEWKNNHDKKQSTSSKSLLDARQRN